MAEKSQSSDPIIHTVWVDCPIEEAFRLFTEGFAEWWPLQEHSLSGEEAERCELEPRPGGRLFERGEDGREAEWGSIIAWEPPGRLEFTWHPGRPEDRRETVEVEFQVEADGTRVTLIHHGWNRGGEPGWSTILNCAFAAAARGQLVA